MRVGQRSRISPFFLALALLITLFGLNVVERARGSARSPYYRDQIEAAKLMRRSLAAIRDQRLAAGFTIDAELDPNRTGLIGRESTVLTTSIGNLPAKRTSTNPAFAALLVKYFREVGLERGDVVAIGASGSFPALLVATLAAARVLDLEPIVIYSIGASMYGANIPRLTFLDMLAELNRRGLLPYQVAAVSLGGEGDQGIGLRAGESREAMSEEARRSGAPLVLESTVAESIQRRLALYERASRGRPIRCFVNIGGADPNYGVTTASLDFPNGLVKQVAFSLPLDPARGLIFEFAARGLPVINLLDVRGLALKHGLPIDPIPLPPIGQGGVYYRSVYPRQLILVVLVTCSGILIVGVLRSNSTPVP